MTRVGMSSSAARSSVVAKLAMALAICALGACADPEARPHPQFSRAERAAFNRAPKGGLSPRSLPLRLVVPGDGAVIPWTFPSPELRWEDGFQGDAFRLRVRSQTSEVLEEAITSRRRHRFPEPAWQHIRRLVGEGGSFEVELVGLSMGPDARALRGPVVQVSRVRFSAEGEHPTGQVFYAFEGRPPGAPPGPMGYERRLVVPMSVDMNGQTRQLAVRPDKGVLQIEERGRPGGKGATATPAWVPPLLTATATESRDFSAIPRDPFRPAYQAYFPLPEQDYEDRSLLVTSETHVAAIEGVDGAPRAMTVARASDGGVVFEASSVFSPRFHPQRPSVLLYSLSSNEIGLSMRGTFFRSDIRVVDLETGEDRPVPGASDPRRCEVYPDWTPDGRSIVFSRSPLGEPCDGHRGRLEIARVAVEGEDAGRARVLVPPTDALGSAGQPRVSPDGRWIVFTRAARGLPTAGTADLWLVSASGGDARPLGVSTDAIESWHAFSPDGRWLAFQSNRERVDEFRVYLSRFFEDGRVSPALPLPGAGDDHVSVVTFEWSQSPLPRKRLSP